MQIAAGQFFLVQLNHFTGGAGFGAQRLQLFFAAIDPDDMIRFGEGDHFVYPFENMFVGS